MPPTPHLRISPAQRSDQKRPSPAPARGFLCPQISPPPPMKRPGTPLLFILSNQPPPQQKNTAPPDTSFPLTQTLPPFPPPTTHPGCLLLFIPGQPPPPSEKTPPRLTGPPRTLKLSYPSHHLLPDPSNFLFLCPTQPPPFLYYISTRRPPKCGGEKKNRSPPSRQYCSCQNFFGLSATSMKHLGQPRPVSMPTRLVEPSPESERKRQIKPRHGEKSCSRPNFQPCPPPQQTTW